MTRRGRLWLGAAAAAVLLAGTARIVCDSRRLAPSHVLVVDGLPELSGLVYHPRRRSLIGVGDGGVIAELDLDGRVLRRADLGFDLEDVGLTPAGDRALVVAERESSLLVVDVATFSLVATHPLERLAGATPNKGLEGLAVLADGGILLAHEKKPCALIEISWPAVERRSVTAVDFESISAVLAAPRGREIAVLARSHGLRLVRRDGHTVGEWKAIDDYYAEALALVPGRGLYVGIDRVPSRIRVYEGLDTWERLRDRLAE